MTFIHPLLLSGLVLTGLPVLLHLIMRQKPKRLIFPAFRFLAARQQTNQRKLRLRHLLLLLLRMAILALFCLALSRPRVFSDRVSLGGDRPVAAALAFDTSPSMGYTVAGVTRLDEAKRRGRELLDEIPDGSRVAVLDSAEPGGEWAGSVADARARLDALQLHPGAGPVTDAVAAAYRLFADLDKEPGETGDDTKPRFLYAFSDRTPAGWDGSRLNDLKSGRDRVPPPAVAAVLIDVGVEMPADLAVAELMVKPAVVAANKAVVVTATVRATGQDYDTVVSCRLEGSSEPPGQKPVKVAAGQSVAASWEFRNLPPGQYQAEVSAATADALPASNSRFVTWEVRPPRKVLVLTAEQPEGNAGALPLALRAGGYAVDVKSADDAAVSRWGPGDLAAYDAVMLLSVREPGRAGSELWDKLTVYVTAGGGLGVFPGGDETKPDDYRKAALLPADLVTVIESPAGASWGDFDARHPFSAPWAEWARANQYDLTLEPRRAFRYWSVTPRPGAAVLARYNDPERRPAVLASARGRVLLFTSPFDYRGNDYNDSANSFFPVTVNLAARYLAGELEDATFTHPVGRAVVIPLPPSARFSTYTLQGPGLAASELTVNRPADAAELRLTAPRQPGHYMLSAEGGKWSAKWSLNLMPEESLLLPRLPEDSVTELFGPEGVLAPEAGVPLKAKIEGHLRQPLELYGWLMILVVLALAAEGVFANRFYRVEAETRPGR